MPRDVSVYRWECPICPDAKLGLSPADAVTVEEQAANALASHVRTRIGGGHGGAGELPAGFDRDSILEHVELEGEVDDDRLAIRRS